MSATRSSSLARKVGAAPLFVALGCVLFAQAPELPPNYPKAQYEESKVPPYTLPDPLVLLNGKKVPNAKTWVKKRRPEVLKLFATYVYGRTMAGRPKEMTFEVVSTDTHALDNSAITKTVTLYFVGKKDGPKMDLHITLPAHAGKPVPIFLVPGDERSAPNLVAHGYGLANFLPGSLAADNKDGYAKSIRAFFAPPGQAERGPDEWGAIGA
jgi:hypothetical protein